MPLDPNIALQGQVANPFQSMGQAVQTASGLAQLANVQQQNQLMQAETQNLNQSAQYNTQIQNERNVYQSAMQNKNSPFYNADGTIDPDKFQVWGNQNVPLMNSEFGGAMLKQNQAINEYHSTVANMATKDHDIVNAQIGSWVKPDGTLAASPLDMIKQLEASRSQLSGPGKNFVDQAQNFILNNKDNPQALAQGIAQYSRTTTSPENQATARRASNTFVNTGGATVPVSNTGEYGAQIGTPTGQGVANTLTPGERQTVGTMPGTNTPVIITRSPNGMDTTMTSPSTQGVYVPQPGDDKLVQPLTDERTAAKSAYLAAPTQHTNNQLILSNIDNVGATGKSGQAWRTMASMLGFDPGAADKNGNFDQATAYDLVGKGLERNAVQAASAMGNQTATAINAQVAANGSLNYTPAAIKEVTKLNDAITTGTQSYQPGLERAISSNPSAGIFAKKQFDQQWGANFMPEIFELINAKQNGDQAGEAAIVKKLGGTDSDAYKAMLKKAANLRQLSNTGGLQ